MSTSNKMFLVLGIIRPFHLSLLTMPSHVGDMKTSMRQIVLLVMLAASTLYMNLSLLHDVRSIRAKQPRTTVRPISSYSKYTFRVPTVCRALTRAMPRSLCR
jgi:hypothetical protein